MGKQQLSSVNLLKNRVLLFSCDSVTLFVACLANVFVTSRPRDSSGTYLLVFPCLFMAAFVHQGESDFRFNFQVWTIYV